VSPLAPVVQTDRPEQPKLKAPEGQAAPAYAPSAAAVTPARVPGGPPLLLKGAEVVAIGVSEWVFQNATCPAWSDAAFGSAIGRRSVACQIEGVAEPGSSLEANAARRR
jgi:hypothetical protein